MRGPCSGKVRMKVPMNIRLTQLLVLFLCWSIGCAPSWSNYGFTRDEEQKWQQAGFGPLEAQDWKKKTGQVSPAEARAWRSAGFTPSSAKPYYNMGINVSEAQEWEKYKI